tara:strand:- start:1106 stop:2293 length:1188 start_codon:yes stop_codon:yes gene_type:complete
MAAITYGPMGTKLYDIDGTYYLGYEYNGNLFLWTIPNNDLSSVTDFVAGENKENFFQDLGDAYEFVTADDYADAIVNGSPIWKAGSITDITVGEEGREDTIQNTITALDDAKNELPWWSDPEYTNLVFELMVESPENWEALLLTDDRLIKYLDDNDLSKSEYNAKTLNRRDPQGREDRFEQQVITINKLLSELEAEMSKDAIDYAANRVVDGAWGTEKLSQQINAAVDPYSTYTTDKDFQNIIDGGTVSFAKSGENRVESLMRQYLPKKLWNNINVAQEASKIRAEGEDKFIERLKELRYSMYDMYDKDIAWETIRSNKVSAAETILGIEIQEGEEHWNLVEQLIQMNNVAEEDALIREYGFNNNNPKVMKAYLNAQASSFGSGEVRTQDMRSDY